MTAVGDIIQPGQSIADRACAGAAATVDRPLLVDSVAGTLLALNADIVIHDDGQGAHIADEPKWRGQAEQVVDELLRAGLVGR